MFILEIIITKKRENGQIVIFFLDKNRKKLHWVSQQFNV